MEYYYLIVYCFENGYGTAQITRKTAIINFEDCIEIEKQISKQNNFKAHLMNYTLVGSKEIEQSKSETMDSIDYLEYLKEKVDGWLEEIKGKQKKGKKNELINKTIAYAEKIIEQANEMKDTQKGLIYTNICKNCGKEIKVARKNNYFCNEQCKKEYMKKYRHNRYKNMSAEDKEKMNKEAIKRMKELRAKRKEIKQCKN